MFTMPKVSMKKNQSCIQVLKTLQVLLQGNFTMHELIAQLNAGEKAPVFNNAVISKYINTCRYCGIDIPKIHNRYFVTSMPFGFELEEDETGLLEMLQNIIRQNMSKKYNKIFDEFVEKLNRFSNKKLARVEKDTYQISAELFEHAVSDKRKIRLMFKNRDIYDCIPVKMALNNGKTFFHVIYKNKDRMIDIERVSGIEVLNEKFIANFSEQVVVFELKGALAPRYNLRENERLVKSYDGNSIIVSNQGESQEILFSRLLRYDDKCEILHPKNCREEMAGIINSMLDNYKGE